MKWLTLLFFLWPLSSFAVDGVLEINQACIESGCFAGDAPGLPVTLANSGSYRLTSNVDVSSYSTPENQTAIEISGNSVSLDLNGFAVIGPSVCSGFPSTTACTPTGSGVGINSVGPGGNGVAISNGHIRGMGANGLFCSSDCRVSRVIATGNGFSGIVAINRSIVTESTANRNRFYGIEASGLVADSVADGNGTTGVVCSGCSVRDSAFSFNGFDGISFSASSTFGGNKMLSNGTSSITGTALATAPNLCGATACP